jgi:hypothetical protein
VATAPDHLGWQNESRWPWHHSTGRPDLIGAVSIVVMTWREWAHGYRTIPDRCARSASLSAREQEQIEPRVRATPVVGVEWGPDLEPAAEATLCRGL